MSETWTVGRLLTWTTDYLKKHGAENPRLDAEVLLAAARNCERIMLYTAFEEVVADDLRAKFRDLVKRRAEGTPVAYLVGKKEFFSLSLRVTPDVLIPRPETEHVVVAALDVLNSAKGLKAKQEETGDRERETGDKGQETGVRSQESESAIRNPKSEIRNPLVADVGTGSGAIAIAIAKHAPHCRVRAIDLSPTALVVAQANAADHQVADRIEFLDGDLLSPLPPEPRFTVVASNPPYVAEGELAEMSPQVKDHEPRLALVAGQTGTEVIERLIPQAAERLLAGGWLIFELSPMIASKCEGLLAADSRFEPATLIKDLAGHARVLQARRKP